MRLTEASVFEVLSWALAPTERWTFVDAGAHRGAFSRRLAAAFPNSTVHAFEPNPGALEKIRAQRSDRIRVWAAAIGDRSGSARFRLNRDDETSGLLTPNANAERFHADAHRLTREIDVPVERLDDWAIRERIGPVHAIKLDVQGTEVAAIRGADRLLRESVVAVYSEAQFIPEYKGASLFGEIDAELRARGFTLFQIVDVQPKGALLETASCDALWLREDVAARLRANPPRSLGADDRARFRAVFDDLASRDRAVAIYGAGTHTRTRLVGALEDCPARVLCVIDDNPADHGRRLWGFPIVSRDRAIALGVDAIVISSDLHERAIFDRCEDLRRAGVEIVCLYGADRETPQPTGERLACR
jgi:FkbM family methyltransferase